MQPPIEILAAIGPSLGFHHPWQFFWGTGALSSFLDNAPTYVVFFELAKTVSSSVSMPMIPLTRALPGASSAIAAPLLAAISCGAVFMGAVTYLGNGPNFMVRSIARHSGVRMPTFFGYMIYSFTILLPVFALMTWIFF